MSLVERPGLQTVVHVAANTSDQSGRELVHLDDLRQHDPVESLFCDAPVRRICLAAQQGRERCVVVGVGQRSALDLGGDVSRVGSVVRLGLLQCFVPLAKHFCVGADRLGDVDVTRASGQEPVDELSSVEVNRLLDAIQVVVDHAVLALSVAAFDHSAVV
jgi:hypothetical protein